MIKLYGIFVVRLLELKNLCLLSVILSDMHCMKGTLFRCYKFYHFWLLFFTLCFMFCMWFGLFSCCMQILVTSLNVQILLHNIFIMFWDLSWSRIHVAMIEDSMGRRDSCTLYLCIILSYILHTVIFWKLYNSTL